MSIRSAFALTVVLATVFGSGLAAGPSPAQDETAPSADTGYLLRWSPELQAAYACMLSTSGTRGESIAVRTENFTIEVTGDPGGPFTFTAKGEPVPEGAALALRFQRALFPEFRWTVDSLGQTETEKSQPFPPFCNIPIFPEDRVREGSSWSGGPVAVLPDANVSAIPFTFESTLISVSDFQGERCAVIESTYSVCLPEGAISYMPFLGLVEGDPPEQAGTGASVGGVVENSRGYQAGIRPGDLIIEAEGQRIRGWGGLEDLIPILVPDLPVEFRLLRGEEELSVKIAPEPIPLAYIAGTGGLKSTCYFSLDRGIPLKTDLNSENLVFTLTNSTGEQETREVDIRIVLEYRYGGR